MLMARVSRLAIEVLVRTRRRRPTEVGHRQSIESEKDGGSPIHTAGSEPPCQRGRFVLEARKRRRIPAFAESEDSHAEGGH